MKNILRRTLICLCAVIALGFAVTSIISYKSNRGIFERDMEHVSKLTSEGIYHQIDSIFTKPVSISLTMANDTLLKDFLDDEKRGADDEAFVQKMSEYLMAYREQYSYDSIFLVSTETGRYYHFNGVDRVLKPDNSENTWYYAFLESDEKYALNVDNDEAAGNEVTVFVNCKIRGRDGEIMGVVGVGFRVDSLQALLKNYESNFDVHAYLIDSEGTIEISTKQTGFQATNLFQDCGYPHLKDEILSDREKAQSFWYDTQEGSGFLVTRYVPNLEWFLVIDNDTSALVGQLNRQFYGGMAVVVAVILIVLLLITSIFRKYNARIIKLTLERESEHRHIFQEETEKLYENIYEVDITHNLAASEATEKYFVSLGVPNNTPYDKALLIIAQKQIKEEFRQGYLATFSPENVMRAFQEGKELLSYDFMITNDGKNYYWMRIKARIFYWNEDESVRILVYRQNIDAEKNHEKQMLEQMQKDSLSKLYNKAATQEHIRKLLDENPDNSYAFFIVDIDNFKRVNDTCGHSMGDAVIADFASRLRRQFRRDDIVGRVGGDEFVVFVLVPSLEWVVGKSGALVTALRYDYLKRDKKCKISASIGIAITPGAGVDFETLYQNADSALYLTKKNGKDGFTIFKP